MPAPAMYRTGAFAALAGVTPRALRLYDRLGLLKPRRTDAGYRVYSDRDLEVLEEIVALKFIGVPLKDIAAIRRRTRGPFRRVLQAQREALECRRRSVSRAIAAIAAAEAELGSRAAPDAQLVKRIIEVINMDKQHDEAVSTYSAMLKAKTDYLASLSVDQRADLKRRWSALAADIREAANDDPAGPRAQALLDRWLLLMQEFGGGRTAPSGPALDIAQRASPELRSDVWARRTEWLPPSAIAHAADTGDTDGALARARARAESFVGGEVMEFISRARAARKRI